MTAQEGVELAKALAWPVTVLLLVVTLHQPITDLLRTIGQRTSKFKIFQFEFELGKLVPASVSLLAAVEALQQAVVQASGSQLIIAGVTRSATADYALVALGADADHAWLTSRLFLLSALLDRNRVVRCIVFTGKWGTFVGAASPRDVRGAIGARFPEYERALFAAYGTAANLDPGEFRNGDLSETALTTVAYSFLQASNISVVPPTPPAVLPAGWVYLDRSSKPTSGPSTWELAEYVTAGSLRAMLRDRLAHGSVVAAPGASENEDATRAILKQTGTFVARVSASGEFRELCDRAIIADKVARSAAEQVASS
jgi:hypothetical protein